MKLEEIFNVVMLTFKAFTTKEKYLMLFFSLILIFSLGNIIFGSVVFDRINKDEKGVYIEGLVGEIGVLNPLFSSFSVVDSDITGLIFQGLSRYDPVAEKVVDNEAIATHSLSEDQKKYVFYINKNAKWHDGYPINADDVIFTYRDVIQSPNFSNIILAKTFENVKIEKIDEYTVSFTLDQKNSFFFTNTLVGLMPKHIWAEVDVASMKTSEINNVPIGNGPYRFVSIEDLGNIKRVILTRFDDYFGRKANISTLSFLIFPTFEDLKDNIQMVHGLARVAKFNIDDFDKERFSFYKYRLPRYTALFLNTDSAKLKSKKMRLAIQKALDKGQIVSDIGYEKTLDTPLLELKEGEWLLKGSKDEAQGALFDEGWKMNEKTGFRENKDGEVLSLRLLTRKYDESSQEYIISEKLIDLIKTNLKEVGIDLVVESYAFNFLQYTILDRDYDLLLYGQNLGYNPDLYSYLHSSQAKGRGLNLSNYRNIKVDVLLEDIRNTFQEDVKQKKLKEIGDILVQDIPAVYLYIPTYYYVVDKKINIGELGSLAAPFDRFANIYDWTFSP